MNLLYSTVGNILDLSNKIPNYLIYGSDAYWVFLIVGPYYILQPQAYNWLIRVTTVINNVTDRGTLLTIFVSCDVFDCSQISAFYCTNIDSEEVIRIRTNFTLIQQKLKVCQEQQYVMVLVTAVVVSLISGTQCHIIPKRYFVWRRRI